MEGNKFKAIIQVEEVIIASKKAKGLNFIEKFIFEAFVVNSRQPNKYPDF